MSEQSQVYLSERVKRRIAEDRIRTRRGLKRSAWLMLLVVGVVILISSNMPTHFLARWLGLPVTILFLLSFPQLLFFGGRYAFDWFVHTKNRAAISHLTRK